MQGAGGLSTWNGKISIIGSPAAPGLTDAERRFVRAKCSRKSAYATSISVASTDAEYRQAEDLVRSAYSGLGYDTAFLVSQGANRRKDRTRLTLLSNLDSQPAGTFTAFLDGPDGVQADLTYPETIDSLRRAGKFIVELGQFATLAFDNLQASQQVISALHNGVYLICASLKQEQTTIVFEVNPHHVNYWHSLGWQVSGPTRRCNRVNAPGVLMIMDFAAYTQILLQCWPREAQHRDISHRAWHRVIRYSMLWDDVDGVLSRISQDTPLHPEPVHRHDSDGSMLPQECPAIFANELPASFQSGTHHG